MGCCRTLNGIARCCDSNVGGIRRAWIAPYEEIGKRVTNKNGEIITNIEGIKDSKDVESKINWKDYHFRKQTGSITSTINRDDAAGSLYYENVITLQFVKQETDKRLEINALAMDDLAVIVEDNNGRYWFFGYDFPVTLSDGSAETGTALGDMNGYSISLLDISKELPYEIFPDDAKRILTNSIVNDCPSSQYDKYEDKDEDED